MSSAPSVALAGGRSGVPELFGHPAGLSVLFGTEMWERFSYYGMRALLILYLTKYLLLPGHVEGVIGYPSVKYGFEWLIALPSFIGGYIWHWISFTAFRLTDPRIAVLTFVTAVLIGFASGRLWRKRSTKLSHVLAVTLGGLTLLLILLGWSGVLVAPAPNGLVITDIGLQPLSSLIYGSYTGLIYFTPLPGGWLADRVLGQRRVVVLGIILMAIGHFMMAVESLLFPALFLLVVGGGIFKPNTTGQVGSLYAPGDHRRDRAYSIFYVGVNVGAFVAPLVCGTLGEEVGWHYGFGAAGVGMLIALTVYLIGFNTLPEDELTKSRAAHREKAPLTPDGRRAVFALIILCIPLTLYWACYEQQGNTLNLFTADNTDRSINLLFWRGEIPVTWFQSFNPFMIFAFTPFLVALWTRQATRGTEPNSVIKMTIGCATMVAANLIMVAAVMLAGETGKASWLWLVVYIGFITVGEIYLSPISLSLYSKVAPPQILSTMIAINFIPNFLGGGFLQGWLGSYWSSMSKVDFFLMIAAISAAAGIIVWAFDRPLKPILKE